ncbi:MerR family transcriptional regulator, partial [Lactobacillus parabuchneri]|nr:MerR family transcriptional regulator [Lentilactobacillus parabuchneri]
NISGIKEVYKKQSQLEDERKRNLEKGLTDSDVRKILQDEFLNIGGLKPPSSSFDDPNSLNKLNH